MRLRNLSIVSLAFIPTPALATTYVCEACPAGTWGDGTNCNTCKAGTYAYAGASSCTSCLTTGVKSCDSKTGKATSCKSGFGLLSSGSCARCSAGTYSPGGTSGCYSCSSGYYSYAGASKCISCSTKNKQEYKTCSTCCGGSTTVTLTTHYVSNSTHTGCVVSYTDSCPNVSCGSCGPTEPTGPTSSESSSSSGGAPHTIYGGPMHGQTVTKPGEAACGGTGC